MKFFSGAALILSTVFVVTPAYSAESCDKVTIADMSWNSATLLAHIDQFVLQHGFGCRAELVPGDTMATGASMMTRGEPDIAPEFWTNSMKEALDRGVGEGSLKVAGIVLPDGGEEGFWVPQYMVDKYPEMATIAGVIKHAKLFKHPEYSGKSALYGCPSGWNCQISSGNLFKALELGAAGFELVDPGSGAALAGSIARAYDRQKPWLGYYWAPTAVMGKYPMVKVDFGVGPADVNEFLTCTSQIDCLEPKVTMYPPAPARTIVTTTFADRSSQAMDYLEKRSFSNTQMNQLLAWMEENQADGEMAMEHFLREYQTIWQDWLAEGQREKVKKAVERL